jgi:hypothetical protein
MLHLRQIAARRFSDNVRSTFQNIFLQSLTKDVLGELTARLGLYREDAISTAKRFLLEDPEVVQRRDELLAKEATLSKSIKVITSFLSGAL